jgi:putative ABC transport system ATP-binding protein
MDNANNTPVIAVENLMFSHNKLERPVLRDINVTINSNEIVMLTGPSGSGKSTFLTIVGALRRASIGRVDVLGQRLIGADNKTLLYTRRQIGYIFQQHNLIESLTALQNVCMTLEMKSFGSEIIRQNIAMEMLDRVGLKSFANKYPNALSGGQRQRVSIARALVGVPKIVLADEPTASLDKISGGECVEILSKATILMVTHDPRVLHFANRIMEMEDGLLRQG